MYVFLISIIDVEELALYTCTVKGIDCIKMYYFSTLYATISHDKLKYKLFEIIDNFFLNKDGTRK